MALTVVPITLKAANAYVAEHHRHHRPVVGHKYSVAVANETGAVVGVAIIGRPVSRVLDDGATVEVTRVCTTGVKDACSALYGAARRVAKALGYQRILTYILASEPGTSLKAAGWVKTADSDGGSWSCPTRPREDKAPTGPKTRWEATL